MKTVQNLAFRSRRLTSVFPLFTLALCIPVCSAAESLPVTAASLDTLLIYPARTAPASVVSTNDSRISAEVSAVIERIPVEVGQVVEPDTPLVELEQTDINLAIQEAEATMKSLRAQNQQAIGQLRRVRSLVKKKAVTEENLSKRDTEVKVTGAALVGQQIRIEKLGRQLEKTVARAPFKAIVVERIANVGELAMVGTPLVRVMDATHVEVVAELQPDDIPSLTRAKSPLLVTKDSEFPLRLQRIIPVIDERERSQEVRLVFAGDGALIGTSGHITWREARSYLPADLLVRRGDHLGVFVLAGEVARFVAFPAAQEGRPALNVLPPDSILILDGRFVIQDGQAVKVKHKREKSQRRVEQTR